MIEDPANTDSSDDRRLHHRRGFARASARWPVTIISGGKTLEGRVQNISQGGVLVFLKENLSLHETIRIAVEIPDCSNVLTAEGEVIRATTLDTFVDNQYTCSAAIQFTDISPQDLKYFSGNLAPEWHKVNSAPEQFSQTAQPGNPKKNKSYKSLILAGSLLCAVLLLLFLVNGDNDGNETSRQVSSLGKKYNDLQSQLKSLQVSDNKLDSIEEQIERLDLQLTGLQEKLTSIASVMEKTVKEQRNAAIAGTEAKSSTTPSDYPPSDDSANERSEPQGSTVLSHNPPSTKVAAKEPEYYQVKKGETLYRISVKHNTTVSGLQKLNNLSIDDRIYPGQKLRIK